jgi:hypothetical protein
MNPFAQFSLLEGKTPIPTDVESDIETGDTALIEDEVDEIIDETGSTKLADEKLKKVAEIQASKSKKKAEIVDDTDDAEVDDIEEVEDNGFKSAITHLSDKGILDISIEDIEDSEEGLEKAVDKTVSTRFEKLLKDKLGDEGLALLSFVEAGGDPKQFISAYYNDETWADYTVDSEASQKIALRESLRLSGETPETIEDMVQEFTDNGTLEKYAKSALGKLQKLEIAQKDELLDRQQKAAIEAKKQEKQRFDDFKAELYAREDIKGFKVTPKVKDNLWNFMTVADKKTGQTGYQKALEDNKDASLMFAYLAMNNFDVTKLEKQVMTKVASKLGGLLKNYKTSSREVLGSGRTEINENGDSPFEGFKTIK